MSGVIATTSTSTTSIITTVPEEQDSSSVLHVDAADAVVVENKEVAIGPPPIVIINASGQLESTQSANGVEVETSATMPEAASSSVTLPSSSVSETVGSGEGISSSSNNKKKVGKRKEEEAGAAEASTGTINLEDFASLLNPKNVEHCICCSTNLLTSLPPSFFDEEKVDILKTFCEIMNIPFNIFRQDVEEEEEEEYVDYPFCMLCTKDKLRRMVDMDGKLKAIQRSFEKLKESIMMDILRVFIGNLVFEEKIPLRVVREKNIHERMLMSFKRHSEKKAKNVEDREMQTDPQVQQYFPAYTPMSQSYPDHHNVKTETTGHYHQNNRRRRGANRKSESRHKNHRAGKVSNRRDSSNFYDSHPYPPSNVSDSLEAQSQDTNNSFDMPGSTSTATGFGTDYLMNNAEPTSFEEANLNSNQNSPYVANSMNGMTFDENGIIGLGEDYFNNYGFGNSSSLDAKGNNAYVNGFSSYDHSSLNDEFRNVLGIMDSFDEMEKKSPVPLRKSTRGMSAGISHSSNFMNNEYPEVGHQVVEFSENKIRIRKVGDEKTVKCKVCDKTIHKHNLKLHMDTIHNEEKPYKCRGCDKRFARRDHFREHEERHLASTKRAYFCHRCGSGPPLITGKSVYVAHCIKDHNIEDDVVECFHFCDFEDCLESYKIKEDFLNHLATHWDIGTPLQCSICDKSFADRTHLETHESEAHRLDESYYDCRFCHMGFEDESDFCQHMIFHQVKMPEEELQHVCSTCGKSFVSLVRLRSHNYNVHVRIRPKYEESSSTKGRVEKCSSAQKNDEEFSPVPAKKPKRTRTTRPASFACKYCVKRYTSEKRLQKHMLKHEDEEEELPDEDEAPEDEAPEEDDEEAELDSGQDEDEEEGEAVEDSDDEPGPASIPETNEIESDSDSAHGSINCQYCRKKLPSREEMRKHLVQKHPDEHMKKGVKHCTLCWYIFKSDAKLEEHVDLKHGSEQQEPPQEQLVSKPQQRKRKLKCKECGKLFSSSETLKTHMQTHIVDKREERDLSSYCDKCDKELANPWSLQRHKERVHGLKKKLATIRKQPSRSTRSRARSESDEEDEDDPDPAPDPDGSSDAASNFDDD